mgnify:CR=1 FL=1
MNENNQKSICCELCSNIGKIDGKNWGCDNVNCQCHAPSLEQKEEIYPKGIMEVALECEKSTPKDKEWEKELFSIMAEWKPDHKHSEKCAIMNQQLVEQIKKLVEDIRIAVSKCRLKSAEILLRTLENLLKVPK